MAKCRINLYNICHTLELGMRHMWPRTPCAYCGTRCGENMPCHSVQCAPYVNTHFQPKIIQKLLFLSLFGNF